MSEQRKKALGRGRGNQGPKAEGPWLRSKKVEEAINTSKYQEDVLSSVDLPKQDEFNLSALSFPPLPGSSSTENSTFRPMAEGNLQSKEETRAFNGNSNHEMKNDSSNLKLNEETEAVTYENLVDKMQSIKIDKQGESVPALPTPSINLESSKRVSNLSPFAKEFVPKAHSMNPSAQDFVPISTYSELDNQVGLSENNHNEEDSFDDLLQQVEDTINFCYMKINESPASYDEVMEVLKPYFERYLRHRNLTEKIVEIIYSYATVDTKFSYHAVRTLTYLDNISFEIHQVNHLRNDTLKLAERKNTEVQTLLLNSEVNSNNVLPFLLFLSELYIHLEVGSKRLLFVGKAIVDTLQKLLAANTLPIKERLSIAVNIVKLTGTFLDEEPQGGLNLLMEDLANKLIEEKPNLDENTIAMVEILIKTRSENWGNGPSENLNNPGPNQTNTDLETVIPLENGQEATSDGVQFYNMGDNTVFYGPDGNILPFEEQMFLEISSNYMYDEEGSELSPGSMDGDMQSAYEEFLLTIPAQKNI